jgi:WD40 repeat protein
MQDLGAGDQPIAAAFDYSGRYIVLTGQSGTVRICNAETDVEVLRSQHEQRRCVALDVTGTRMACGMSDGTVQIVDVRRDRTLNVLRAHQGPVLSVAFDPSNLRVLTAGEDRTARLFDIASGIEIASMDGHEGRVVTAGFDPTGRRIVTASTDGTARVWTLVEGVASTTDQAAEAAPKPEPERQLCFVAIPFGRKMDSSGRTIDFDAVYRKVLAPSMREAGLEPVRAAEERLGRVSDG